MKHRTHEDPPSLYFSKNASIVTKCNSRKSPYLRRCLGSVASCLLHSLASFVPILPNPPSSLLSQPPSLITRQVALSPSTPTSVANPTTSLAPSSGVRASLITSTTS
ncbi:hypothetical protein I7I53_02679 [Histoplasma capsulatum var. duboisii H88]|uniref:Uncharacterized protein n=1 Tax=Ajellomyces capsulatus (strain H88) TaxID=544711 RepID=A0A8A1LNE7_AJEC8|nr:hypothetical protein I7I53_02679 [Histoplasma capsulatum var. duboisii H88]